MCPLVHSVICEISSTTYENLTMNIFSAHTGFKANRASKGAHGFTERYGCVFAFHVRR